MKFTLIIHASTYQTLQWNLLINCGRILWMTFGCLCGVAVVKGARLGNDLVKLEKIERSEQSPKADFL